MLGHPAAGARWLAGPDGPELGPGPVRGPRVPGDHNPAWGFACTLRARPNSSLAYLSVQAWPHPPK
jgi:hypothetical protein